VTPENFALLYEQVRPRALEVCGSEDAVQEAAVYVLARLERERLPLYRGPALYPNASWFIQLCVSRARNAVNPDRDPSLLNVPYDDGDDFEQEYSDLE